MTKRILLIDDLRDFVDPALQASATVARTSAEALSLLKENSSWDEIWFDHDLGLINPELGETHGNIDSTMTVVDYLSEKSFYGTPVDVTTVYIHTSNPAGRRDIKVALDRFGYSSVMVNAEQFFIVGDSTQ